MKLKEILNFLNDLEKNNTREWMTENKPYYLQAKSAFEQFIQELIDNLAITDPDLTHLTAKECTFRLYRDVRFSKDKTPYKTNFGADIKKGGKKTRIASYYVHIQPGKSFIAGGMYMPSSETLSAIRQEIDYQADELKKILSNPTFKSRFGSLQGDRLKRAPKGYQPDDPNIDLLRHKSFIVVDDVTDSVLVKKDFTDHVVQTFDLLKPFNQFLNRALDE